MTGADGVIDEKMSINPNGNVGIGTSTPSEKLHVIGNVITTGNVGIGITDPPSILIS